MGGTGTNPKRGQDEGLRRVFADLHLHIGATGRGEPVKISASRALTFRNIAHEAACRKGIRLLGVIDAHSPGVQRDIAELLDRGEMAEAPGGGIRYRDVTLLLGAEIEVKEPGRGPAHHLVFLRDFDAMRSFTEWLKERMTNVGLSSQRIRASGLELQRETAARGGLFIPAHIFTPHRSLYGSCADRLSDVLDPDLVDAVELGLSADTAMAGLVPELDRYPFLTNSDAHSLARIGREYNALILGEPSFDELCKALRGEDGRGIAANYGLDPRLGKYHRTHCAGCGTTLGAEDGEMPDSPDAAMRCPLCGSAKLIRGVSERVRALGRLAGRDIPRIGGARPPYICQVPLEFIPGVGPKLLERLLDRFGTEMNVLHDASPEALAETAGDKTAALILAAREGRLGLKAGGGGRYGKALSG
jgi:uncharacterized protein (TIGR00375 family)